MASGEGVGGVSHGAIDFRIATKSEKCCANNVKKKQTLYYTVMHYTVMHFQDIF